MVNFTDILLCIIKKQEANHPTVTNSESSPNIHSGEPGHLCLLSLNRDLDWDVGPLEVTSYLVVLSVACSVRVTVMNGSVLVAFFGKPSENVLLCIECYQYLSKQAENASFLPVSSDHVRSDGSSPSWRRFF